MERTAEREDINSFPSLHFIEAEGKAPERFRQRCQKRFKIAGCPRNLLARLPESSVIFLQRKGRQHCHGFPMPAFGEFTESGHVKFIHWEVMKTSNKHRINLALSPDNPLQKEAIAVLSQAPPGTRTTLICQALCDYQKNEALVEKLRSAIREELSNTSIQAAPKSELAENAVTDNQKALDFIRSLQGN